MWYLLIFVAIFVQSYAQNLLVDLADGKVLGTLLNSPSGKTFYAWRRIPYAKPPTGKLRFQPPVKPDPWTIVDGSEDSKACIPVESSFDSTDATGGYSEDCLYINVYSPVEPNSSLSLPVMVRIFGGQFALGSGGFADADPTSFLEEGVIFVTFNYRLSIFGFLSTEDNTLLGNSALKDQVAALIWIKENIASFGGNPGDITVVGESAGAISIACHLISPMSKNLFTGAILQSGTNLLNYLQTDARNNALAVAMQVNSSITRFSSSEEILDALQTTDAALLVNITLEKGIQFRPVLEIQSANAFISQPFYETIEAGNFSHIPTILGITSEEGMIAIPDLATGQRIAASYDANPSLLLPAIKLKAGVKVATVTQEIKEAYGGNATFRENLTSFVKWFGDSSFVRPVMKHAILQAKFTPVYFYQFSFIGSRSVQRPDIPGCGKVAHNDDLPYFFNISNKPIRTDADYVTRRRVVKLWTNFAKSKNPTPNDDSTGLLQNIKWEPFNPKTMNYLDIGENLELKTHLKTKQTVLWDHIWNTYSVHPYNTF